MGGQPLAGRGALVTGASSGIGAASALRLAAAGATVLLTARRADNLARVAERINRRGVGRAFVVACDLTDEGERQRLVQAATEQMGRVDILVNNAGYSQPGSVEDVPLTAWRAQFELNLFAVVDLMRAVLPAMRQQGWGRIINISSVAGRVAVPGSGVYAASKYALEAASDAARIEAHRHGVRVVLVEPGIINTEIWERGEALSGLLPRSGTAYGALYRRCQPVAMQARRRGASPDVVARAVLHAATAPRPRARYAVPASAHLLLAARFIPTAVLDPLLRAALA